MTKPGVPRNGTDGDAINWRRTADGVELYDETNPDAWIHADFTAGVAPEHRLFMICPECGAVAAHRSKPASASSCGACGATFDHGLDRDRLDV